MLARNDLLAYLREHYGRCDRDTDKINNCYWGKDSKGRFNGCLHPSLYWKGTACPHWQPIADVELDEMASLWVNTTQN